MKYPDDFINKIICGDCLEVMKDIPDNCIDTIITDPPYGLEFMGKEWDKFGISKARSEYLQGVRHSNKFGNLDKSNSIDGRRLENRGRYSEMTINEKSTFQEFIYQWATEALRVTKPGATLLCFGGTRTYHRLACAIEDAGWILKDCIMWLYGSGFPKASDISKQIDKNILRVDLFKPFAKHFKAQRLKKNLSHKDIAEYFPSKTGRLTGCVWNWENGANVPTIKQWNTLKPLLDLSDDFLPLIKRIEAEREIVGKDKRTFNYASFDFGREWDLTIPATPEAQLWNGWKSHGLKPAYEPILVAMKLNEGSYANNALKWGVAGLNIDGGRIGNKTELHSQSKEAAKHKGIYGEYFGLETKEINKGRYPANVILDEESAILLDQQAPKTGAFAKVKSGHSGKSKGIYHDYAQRGDDGETFYADGLQGASRFFYCAKASKAERNRGCEGLEVKSKCEIDKMGGAKCTMKTGSGNKRNVKYLNNHPTVKPLALMRYLVKLTLMPNKDQIYSDPFCGSGTTLMACKELKRDYIGIDNTEEYCEIARRRIKAIPETLF